MKMHQTMRGGFTLVELLVVIVIIAALAGLTAPMVMRQTRRADQTEAVSNAKQIGLALFEFDTAYSGYPDSSTAEDVTENTQTTLTFAGGASNDFFRQLIAAEIAQAEGMFYAKTAFSRKPDNVFTSNENALSAGEVGFGYIMNGEKAISSAGNPSRAIAVAALAFPFETGKFDFDIYNGKAVLLKVDNSAASVDILKSSGLAQLGGGKNLLATGDDTVWGTGVTPRIINPSPK